MNLTRRLLVPLLKKPHQISGIQSLLLQARNLNYINKAMTFLEEDYENKEKKFKFLDYNNNIYPPQLPGEERRPAFVCHMKNNIKYSPKKMWYIACFVRGMSVDDALIQLKYVPKKGALVVQQAILEAQQLAVEDHNVEFKSNLWVAESFTSKAFVIKGVRRHARRRFGEVEYKYCHYFVRLEEGKPPLNYYNKPQMDKELQLESWKETMRRRGVISSL